MTTQMARPTDQLAWVDEQDWHHELVINWRDGEWYVRAVHQSMNGTPMPEYLGQASSWRLDCPDAPDFWDWMESEETQALIQRVVDGFDTRWNGNNHIGTFTDDAQAARDALDAALGDEPGGYPDYPQLPEGAGSWNAYDWFEGEHADVPADATDDDLGQLAEQLRSEAGEHLATLEQLDSYLRWRRDVAQRERDEERSYQDA